MNKRSVQYYSDGVRLEGLIVAPADLRPNDRRPTVIICSGFQGVKEWVPSRWWPQFVEAGFVCLAFDYRGFGTSDGERGRIVPEEEIADVRCSITFLQQQPEVDPRRISLLGWGLGGGIAIAAAARDTRAIAVACVNGLGDGGRTVRDAVPYPAWLDMQERLAADRVKRVMTGQSDHVPYREVTHPGGLLTAVEQSSGYAQLSNDGRSAGKVPVETFSLQSAEAYYHFRPELEVGQISPRSLLIVHGASNPYMPVDEAHRLHARAGEPRELLIILGGSIWNGLSRPAPFTGPTSPGSSSGSVAASLSPPRRSLEVAAGGSRDGAGASRRSTPSGRCTGRRLGAAHERGGEACADSACVEDARPPGTSRTASTA